MSDKFVAYVLPHIAINLGLIILAYAAMNRRFFSRPHWLLIAGLVFMVIAASEKFFFGVLKNVFSVLADLDPALLFLEVSVAALGGNLVASAFLSKAQSLHNQWEKNQFDVFARANLQLLQHNRKLLAHRANRTNLTATEYEARLSLILDTIENEEATIDRIQRQSAVDGKLS